MPVWLTAFFAALTKVITGLAKSIMLLLAAREVGRLGSEKDAHEEAARQRQQADEIYNEGSDNYPDRYLRD